jgi:hypothetical protein
MARLSKAKKIELAESSSDQPELEKLADVIYFKRIKK